MPNISKSISDHRPLLPDWRDGRMRIIFILGWFCGEAYSLISNILGVRLAEAGADRPMIGMFSLAVLPYALKWLWAPAITHGRIPWITSRFGPRRGWLLVALMAMMVSQAILAWADLVTHPWQGGLVAILAGFAAASLDLLVDAFRVDCLEPEESGHGATALLLGLLLGMAGATALALYMATWLDWTWAYLTLGLTFSLGLLAVGLAQEPIPHSQPAANPDSWHQQAVIAPITEFLERSGWGPIVLFMLLYRIGDALIIVLAGPFYLESGYTKVAIADLTYLPGLPAALLGSLVAGILINRFGMIASLRWSCYLEMIATCTLAWMASQGPQTGLLALAIGVNQLNFGFGTVVWVTYLTRLCHPVHAAVQYSLFSSTFSLSRVMIATSAGFLADGMGWTGFFIAATLVNLPGLMLIPTRSPFGRQDTTDA